MGRLPEGGQGAGDTMSGKQQQDEGTFGDLKGKGQGGSGVKGKEIESPKETDQVEKRGRGRPRGKHSDKNMTRATAYIPKDLYIMTKLRLTLEEKYFSDLIEELLTDWLHKKEENWVQAAKDRVEGKDLGPTLKIDH